MCEWYDHDTRVAREKALTERLNAGESRETILAELKEEAEKARSALNSGEATSLEDLFLAEDLYGVVIDFTPEPVLV